MKNFFAIALFLFSTTTISAQSEKCHTTELRKQHIKENPSILEKIREIEAFTKKFTTEYNKLGINSRSVVTLPVVFHIVYSSASENISEAQILSQMTVLNEDFRKLNSNFSSTPQAFQPLAADCELEFCLATLDPDGNESSGITRTSTTVSEIGNTNDWSSTAAGGKDAWDVTKYINIWVCSIDGGNTLGFATLPGTAVPSESDGLVIDPLFVGTTGTVSAPNNLGRTVTHEMGHYFNLEHVWGENGGCGDDDFVTDTPNQDLESEGCPTFPLTDNCTTGGDGIMYCNYMDYVDDDCMTMFSKGQKVRMLAALNGPRSLLLTTNVCGATSSIKNIELNASISTFPNPAKDVLNITNSSTTVLEISLYNIMGNLVNTFTIEEKGSLNIAELSSGIYYLHYSDTQNGHGVKQIIISK